MDNPESLLRRPGLDPRERLLVLFKACIWPGDTDLQARLIRCAEQTGVGRPDLEETILQATLFFGFPRSVTAFEVLNQNWPISPPPTGGGLPEAEQDEAGRKLFASIYGRNDAAVREMLASFHSDFHDFVLRAAYGGILTRPGLTPRTRELLAVGALALMEQWPQFVAHARGALHFGATELEVRETVFTVALDEEHATETVRRLPPRSD
jgi:4-carboxymuconolactone decarboxylase